MRELAAIMLHEWDDIAPSPIRAREPPPGPSSGRHARSPAGSLRPLPAAFSIVRRADSFSLMACGACNRVIYRL